MSTPISKELSEQISTESIKYLKTTASTSLKDAYIVGATAYAHYQERFEQAKKALEEIKKAISIGSNWHADRIATEAIASWKEEGKEGGV